MRKLSFVPARRPPRSMTRSDGHKEETRRSGPVGINVPDLHRQNERQANSDLNGGRNKLNERALAVPMLNSNFRSCVRRTT